MVLDRWPDNFFAETEQVAFCPSHLVPGIDFSNDPLLQGRLFSYLDTQLSRLGLAQFPPAAGERAEVPVRQPAARRPHADARFPRAGSTTSRARSPPTRRARARRAASAAPRSANRASAAASAPRPSPTTTARRGCSSAARPRPSRRIWRRRWCSSCRRSRRAHIREAMVGHLLNIDAGPRSARRRRPGPRRPAAAAGAGRADHRHGGLAGACS